MKYVITEKGSVILGNRGFHFDLAQVVAGEHDRVIAAGTCRMKNGKVEVYGGSAGYGIDAQPHDAAAIETALGV